VLKAFGVTASGTSACLTIQGFTPFFYVKVPEPTVPSASMQTVVRALQRHLQGLGESTPAATLLEARPFKKRDFWGFTNGREFDFLRLTFASHSGMRLMANRLRRTQRIAGFGNADLAIYEANIDPMLRFFHVRDLKPASWIRVKRDRLEKVDDNDQTSSCQREFVAKWTSVDREDRDDVAPLLVASFDIECNSAHGDFPVASKDYRKLGVDLEQAWELGIKERGSVYDATVALAMCMRIAFGIAPPPGDEAGEEARPPYAMAVLQLKRPPASDREVKALDTAVMTVVDDVHSLLRNGAEKGAGGALSSKKRAMSPMGSSAQEQPQEEDDGAASTTLTELVKLLNRAFNARWPLKGDEIIQIGTTVNVYGQRECCARYVYVLGTCDPVEGSVTRIFHDEAEMLVAWADLVRALDPDIVMGYNIFGFDFDYMHARAEQLLGVHGCERDFCRLGRLLETPSKLVKQELSSSAMGDNVLRCANLFGALRAPKLNQKGASRSFLNEAHRTLFHLS